jgi:signal transduction histidine kinase
MGLSLAIRTLAEDYSERGLVSLKFDMPHELIGLPPEVELCFYRVAQEAIQNSVQHANAENIMIKMNFKDRVLSMTITDDGVGFSPVSVDTNDRYGLKGMRERAELIGAELAVESEEDLGTTIRLTKELD